MEPGEGESSPLQGERPFPASLLSLLSFRISPLVHHLIKGQRSTADGRKGTAAEEGWTEEQDVRGGRRRRAATTFATRRPGLAAPRPLDRPCQPAHPRYRVSESCSERVSSAGGRVGEVNASVRGRARLPVPSPYPAAQP